MPSPIRELPAKSRRLTQAERSAASQARLIEAAVKCLVSLGYAATTTHRIAATAEMTMGRMQHQFTTKADIMAAVITSIHEDNLAELSVGSLKNKNPTGRVKEYIQRLIKMFDKGNVLAVFEIRMALKGDPELAATVGPILQNYDAHSFDDLSHLLVAAGVPSESADEWMHVILATLRGFAMERVAGYPSARGKRSPPLANLIDLVLEQIPAENPAVKLLVSQS